MLAWRMSGGEIGNRYSVMAKAGRRTVQVRAYADRIVVRCDGEVVADHRRFFGRDRTLYDPWHYLPVAVRRQHQWHRFEVVI